MKNLIIASTSTVFKGAYLEYLLEPTLVELYAQTNEVLFIPYARPGGVSHDTYTLKASKAFKKINKKLVGIHTFKNPIEALKRAKGIFTGGGNTFLLVSQLYNKGLIKPLRDGILTGIPYLGTSAGSNICGMTMQTTNDMPIVYPPSFKTLGVIPFNINPHYLDPVSGSTHMGETRETRIKEYHTQNKETVIGLREGSWLQVRGESILLKGPQSARVFKQVEKAFEIKTASNFDFIEP